MNLNNLIPENKNSIESYFNMLQSLLPKGVIWRQSIRNIDDSWKDNPTGTVSIDYKNNETGSGATEYKQVVSSVVVTDAPFLARLFYVFSIEFKNFYNRIIDLFKESVPGTSEEMLEDWERLLGLPDSCSPESATISERQAIAHQKYTQGKGDANLVEINRSSAYWISYAAGLGYTIDISFTSDAFRVGDRVGERLYGIETSYTWIVTGDWDSTLQCIFEKQKPAHTTIDWR